MTFFAFGLNHETAPVALRERFALREEAIRHLYRHVRLSPDAEYVVLSTCNRTEVYLFGRWADVHTLRAWMAERAGTTWPEPASFLVEDEAALLHLLEVTAGLKSLVLGDAQIFTQVKTAYQVAVEEEVVGTVMHRLMHTAFRGAKRVAAETVLGQGAASVSTAAAELARRHVEARPGGGPARAVMIGAGQMGRLALEALYARGFSEVLLINRTRARLEPLAAASGADVADWEERHRALADADVVIVATGADAPVLRAESVPTRTRSSECLLIDIAVPRNVDPAIDALPGYRVADLDWIDTCIGEVARQRQAARPAAQAICRELAQDFVTWVFHQQALQPAIHAIRETFETIRRQEIERHAHRFSEADRRELERLTGSIMQKLMAVPIVRLKDTDPGSIDFVRGVKLLSTLFSRPGCDDASEAEASALTQSRLLTGPARPEAPARPEEPAAGCPVTSPRQGGESSVA
ncbi:MAG: glutamyl-tRNA reductase [Bacteroidetes bacterium]|nr:MAG: glutamyl-tRNA reductase [Bacteroidota bacterium]